MIVATAAHARELVADWRGAKPGRSPASWRRNAGERRAMATAARGDAAAVELEIAAIFEAAALEREAEIAEADRAYAEKIAADEIASDAYLAACAAKHRR